MNGMSLDRPSQQAQTLGFNLKPFARLTWTSPNARAIWQPQLVATAGARRVLMLQAVVNGVFPLVLLRLRPFQVPELLGFGLKAGLKTVVLGPTPPPIDELVFGAPNDGDLCCLAGRTSNVDRAAQAWLRGDALALAGALGRPDCCVAAATAEDPTHRPPWSAIMGKTTSDTPFSNFLLHRLGLAAGPWLPCSPDCAETLRISQTLGIDSDLEKILRWPMEWTALHGIAQVLAPVFRLTYNTLSTADKHSVRRGNMASAPPETPRGLAYPYKPPTSKPIAELRTFKSGIRHAERFSGLLLSGSLRRLRLRDWSLACAEPVFVEGIMDGWPALSRWTPEFLCARLGSHPIVVWSSDGTPVSVESIRYLDELRSGGPLSGHQLRDLPLDQLSQDLLADCPTPRDNFLAPARSGVSVSPKGAKSANGLCQANAGAFEAVIWGCRRWAFCPPTSDSRVLLKGADLLDPAQRSTLTRRGFDVRECEQLAGEMVFIPSEWWYQSESVDTSLSVRTVIAGAPGALAFRPQSASTDDSGPNHPSVVVPQADRVCDQPSVGCHQQSKTSEAPSMRRRKGR